MRYIKAVLILAPICCISNLAALTCYIDAELTKIIPADKSIRATERWLTSLAPKSIQLPKGNAPATLNWSGLLYHVVSPEIKCPLKAKKCDECEIIGFHHDYNRAVEQSGLMDFKHLESQQNSSVYHAEVNYKGMTKESTFFPSTWTMQEVAQHILEAAKAARIMSYHPNKGLTLMGKSKDGLEITMLVSTEGAVRSAYPKRTQP